ncbi:MAG: hypothetical protein ABR907_09200 [Terracidiphilus sp.]
MFYFPDHTRGQSFKRSDLFSYSNFGGEDAPSKDLLFTLEHQALWDNAAGVFNPSGLHLRFEKIDEPALAGGAVRYRIFAEGAPENKVYAFDTWTIYKPISADSRNIYVNGQGLLMTHRPKPEQESSIRAGDDEFDVQLTPVSAEPVRFELNSMDGQLKVFGTVVPEPVMQDDQGCRIEARIAQPNASAVLIVADGFPAKTKIPLVLQSEGGTLSETLITDADGHATMGVFPFLKGMTHGILKASAEGPGCLPFVVLPWGAAATSAPEAPAVPSAAKH